ncbi:hypothetical protein HS088_TW21G00155 [Tripterygium wilfordii]|uniref:MADS-box domain-containing protein n=1 Tax=Tripterygium wilfordii TaxID=458696 RepID=A0A7J7C1L6_TRIWF|nr:agamous-like MADS-box protein AGL80 [Tripterygium wilfordii]KAF5728013.1 hypothetical protein HS088_TW21G00155 [Tripterygium wilfordii]
MTRKKVKLAYITNDSARKATFKKRKKGLMKKVSELSTLCGIDACAIVYSPYDSQPEVWPSPVGIQRVLSQFMKMPEMEQSKKMVNQESFLRQRIVKANEQLKKQRKDNREKEMIHVMFQTLTAGQSLQSLNMMDLSDLGWLIDQNLKEIQKAFEKNNNVNDSTTQAPSAPVSGPVLTNPNLEFEQLFEDQKPGTLGFGMNMQSQQWPMDMLNNQAQTGTGTGTGTGTWLPAGEDMILPFGENQPNAFWSSGFFR